MYEALGSTFRLQNKLFKLSYENKQVLIVAWQIWDQHSRSRVEFMTKFTTFQECSSGLVLETSHGMSIDQKKILLVVKKSGIYLNLNSITHK